MMQTFANFDFFFQPTFVGGLRVFKIVFGIALMIDACVLSRRAELSFGANGFLPRNFKSNPRFELLSLIDHSPFFLKCFFVPMFLAGLGFIFDFRPEICGAITFITLASALGKNPYGHHSGRKLALIWSLLVTCAGLQTSATDIVALRQSDWALQLMRIQLCIVYLAAAAHKSQHIDWFNGSMMYKVLAGSTARSGVAMPTLVTYRLGSAIISWMTIVFQLISPILLWNSQTFWIGAAILWGMHLSMQVYLRISTFQLYMVCGPFLFLPERVYEQALRCCFG